MSIYPEYTMEPNSSLHKEREFIELQKQAWQKVSDSLPDDAFADNVNVCEDNGTVSRTQTHVISQLFNYRFVDT